jgi:hypothetical protein
MLNVPLDVLVAPDMRHERVRSAMYTNVNDLVDAGQLRSIQQPFTLRQHVHSVSRQKKQPIAPLQRLAQCAPVERVFGKSSRVNSRTHQRSTPFGRARRNSN